MYSSVKNDQANDPVFTSPARSYEATITPHGDVFASRNVNAAAVVPSANKRFPMPSVIGNIFNHSSSTRSCFKRVWMKLPLPWTCNSGPSCFLSFLISWTTSPWMSVELLQSSFRGVFEATYFFALLIPAALGSFWKGQYPANISYVFLPSNKSKGLLICSVIVLPRKSSK